MRLALRRSLMAVDVAVWPSRRTRSGEWDAVVVVVVEEELLTDRGGQTAETGRD